jgi:hypothetical protein
MVGKRGGATQQVKAPDDGYTAPAVTNLGSVAEMTQGMGGSNFDPGQGTFTKTGNG